MGEKPNQPFQFFFNSSLKVDFQGSRVTSNGGLILVRELDERLGLSELIDPHLTDPRGKNTQLPLADLLRQSVKNSCCPRSQNWTKWRTGYLGMGQFWAVVVWMADRRECSR